MGWKCDTCGEAIETVETGWVEWKVDTSGSAPYRKHGFRLVHHGIPGKKCLYNERQFPEGTQVGDLPLESFVGEEGLMTLLMFMSDHPESLDEIIEMTKRIHIEGYDEARAHFSAAIHEGVFEPNTKPNFYWPSDIAATLNWARNRD